MITFPLIHYFKVTVRLLFKKKKKLLAFIKKIKKTLSTRSQLSVFKGQSHLDKRKVKKK